MSLRARIQQLRDAIARLEQSSPTPDRYALLREMRLRVADLEAGGLSPSALLMPDMGVLATNSATR